MPNDFRQCKMCGQIFRYMGNMFCGNCLREMDEQFRIIKDLLYKNPNFTINQVVEETGVDEKIILYLLREGRLEMKAADGMIVCESCGYPIQSGRLCKKCSSELSSALDSAKPRQSARTERENEKKQDPGKSRMQTYVDRKHY